jgi:kelch-like protein 2/3
MNNDIAQQINHQQQQQHRQMPQQYQQSYRNDVYDVPRSARNPNNNFYVNVPNINQRRSNLHLDFNRPRGPSVSQQRYQRSFDDTESVYGYQGYNNIYERQRDEPLYQNSGFYGRFDVIGTGIGRFERHLSSSCGSIDHCNVGGHYAIITGPMTVNANATNNAINPTSQNPRQDGVKSFFSCLGGESSQSLINVGNAQHAHHQATTNQPSSSSGQRATGAIPKIKTKQSNKVCPKPPQQQEVSNNQQQAAAPIETNNTSNRISKSSLQYLLLNKWLPLGPDYKIIDFNFMFSRNCPGQNGQYENQDNVVQFNGQAEMLEPGVHQPQREYPTMNPTNYPRVIRNTPQLSRLRESDAEVLQNENQYRGSANANAFRARSESPSFSGVRPRNPQEDPFRNWSFNFENNSFRPAGAVAVQEQIPQPRKEMPAIVVEQQEIPNQAVFEQPQASSSKSTTPESSSGSSTSSSSQISRPSEMKKSENYDNLASLQASISATESSKQKKKKSTESQSSDSVTLADDEEVDDAFDELDTDID